MRTHIIIIYYYIFYIFIDHNCIGNRPYKYQHNNTEQKKACLLCICIIHLSRLSVPIHFTKAQNYTLKYLVTLFSTSIYNLRLHRIHCIEL